MISTSNLTIQFGSKPLFENVSVKFGEGNRYGLIGANGSGKSTFMKIIGGDLESSSGNVALDPGVRLGKLRQDQFAFEDERVLDVVMMGHVEMWQAMSERDAIYANLDATEDDYMRAAELEAKFAEYDGYTAQSRAGDLVGLQALVEAHEIAPARVGIGGGQEAFVLEHASAHREPARGAVAQVREDDDRIAPAAREPLQQGFRF